MSNVPFYMQNMRWEIKYGDVSAIDGLAKDGLTDVYHNYARNSRQIYVQENVISLDKIRTAMLYNLM